MTDISTGTPAPVLVITPPRRWTFVNIRELIEFRGLLNRFVIRDLKLRYRQTALGVIWVVLQPLLSAGVFAFVFGRVAKLSSDGVPYFVFAYAGTLGWGAFSTSLTKMSGFARRQRQPRVEDLLPLDWCCLCPRWDRRWSTLPSPS